LTDQWRWAMVPAPASVADDAGWGGLPCGAGRPTMAMITDASLSMETEVEGVDFAREILRIEAEALGRVRERLSPTISQAADLVYRCAGSVMVTGIGKAGLVGQK